MCGVFVVCVVFVWCVCCVFVVCVWYVLCVCVVYVCGVCVCVVCVYVCGVCVVCLLCVCCTNKVQCLRYCSFSADENKETSTCACTSLTTVTYGCCTACSIGSIDDSGDANLRCGCESGIKQYTCVLCVCVCCVCGVCVLCVDIYIIHVYDIYMCVGMYVYVCVESLLTRHMYI